MTHPHPGPELDRPYRYRSHNKGEEWEVYGPAIPSHFYAMKASAIYESKRLNDVAEHFYRLAALAAVAQEQPRPGDSAKETER